MGHFKLAMVVALIVGLGGCAEDLASEVALLKAKLERAEAQAAAVEAAYADCREQLEYTRWAADQTSQLIFGCQEHIDELRENPPEVITTETCRTVLWQTPCPEDRPIPLPGQPRDACVGE